jgi:hypothetical protein
MSRVETHKGRAIPTNMDLFDFLTKHQHLISDDYKGQDDLHEVFYNGLTCGYEKYVLLDDGMVWELDNVELDNSDFYFAEKNPDGSVNYFVSFYNRSCSLTLAVNYAVEKIK